MVVAYQGPNKAVQGDADHSGKRGEDIGGNVVIDTNGQLKRGKHQGENENGFGFLLISRAAFPLILPLPFRHQMGVVASVDSKHEVDEETGEGDRIGFDDVRTGSGVGLWLAEWAGNKLGRGGVQGG